MDARYFGVCELIDSFRAGAASSENFLSWKQLSKLDVSS
jgi:hypothetical protein